MRRTLPPLGALRAFEAAARHMSFQAAATELGVTPTAVSHQVRALEIACGRPLFRRRPRPLTLTEAGERLFPVLQAGFDGFAAAVSALREADDRRPLRVTTTNAFAHRWLVPRLYAWREARPDIPLEVIGTDAALDLHAGEADLTIRYARAAPPGLVAREILRDVFWPMASPALLARGTPIRRPADLLQHPLIHMGWGEGMPDAPTWRRWLAEARRIDPGISEVGNAGELHFREELHAIEAVVAGQGIAVCSDVLAARELQNGDIVRAFGLALPGFGFYLAHLPDHPRRSVIDVFTEWVRTTTTSVGDQQA
ncbi:LysR family transcriptional regulator [Belnapia sp. T6]|uniref:LysR family transcriptional regulator n=1 Tax=Belnapia mucosa TaxID=2804532 RepID=A0ABS1VC99_9PROT|nr:LysR substrate-binding domain-containing protein [Belnapia mucosa]MBL6458766.1 LysR family transcriptional regulator [Belnapia mucosa]